jgi:putative hydrolase of the HAD superfamily
MRPITDQAAAALGGLAALGLTLVLASNTRDDQDRNRALRAAGVADLFSLVLQSHRLGVAKPGARFFGYLRHMAGCRAGELLMVGNRIELDVRPAVELGMPAVLIAPDRPSDLPAGARHLPDIALLPGLLAGGPVHG